MLGEGKSQTFEDIGSPSGQKKKCIYIQTHKFLKFHGGFGALISNLVLWTKGKHRGK